MILPLAKQAISLKKDFAVNYFAVKTDNNHSAKRINH